MENHPRDVKAYNKRRPEVTNVQAASATYPLGINCYICRIILSEDS